MAMNRFLRDGKKYIKTEYLTSIFLIVIFYWVLFYNPYVVNSESYPDNHFFFHILILLALLYSILVCIFNVPKLHIGKIDLLVSLFICYILISYCVLGRGLNFGEGIFNFTLISTVYYINRLTTDKTNIFLISMICLSYAIELYVLILQIQDHFAIADTYSGMFIVATGTMGNSGLATAYIVALFPLTIYLLAYLKSKKLKLTLISLLVVLTTTIILVTQSRSSLIAFLSICFFLIFKDRSMKNIYVNFRYKKVTLFSIIICCVLFAYYIINLKVNSAIGRTLVWYVSSRNILSSPFFGIGYGNFQVQYMNWQADFFSKSDNTTMYPMLADIVDTPFNEPLRILIETGVIGLSIFSLLIYCVIIVKKVSKANNSILFYTKLSLLSISIFSLFSYPLHSTPILYLSILLISIIAKYDSKVEMSNYLLFRIIMLFLIVITSILINFSLKKTMALRYWNSAKNDAEYNNENTLKKYLFAYSQLKNNGQFLCDYGITLFHHKKYRQAIAVLELSQKKRIILNSYIYEGLAYEKLHNYKKARANYLHASAMLPNRFTPKYYLVKNYLLVSDTLKAHLIANDILKMKIKVPSAEVENIRQEMRLLVMRKSKQIKNQ